MQAIDCNFAAVSLNRYANTSAMRCWTDLLSWKLLSECNKRSEECQIGKTINVDWLTSSVVELYYPMSLTELLYLHVISNRHSFCRKIKRFFTTEFMAKAQDICLLSLMRHWSNIPRCISVGWCLWVREIHYESIAGNQYWWTITDVKNNLQRMHWLLSMLVSGTLQRRLRQISCNDLLGKDAITI